MTGGTHAQRIIELLTERPGLDDDEIAKALGIEPRQTVNQICRRLAAIGQLRREPAPFGKIVNLIGEGSKPAPPGLTARGQEPVADSEIPTCSFQGPLIPDNPAKTMLIIPCSSAKRDCADPGPAGATITQSLPTDLAAELMEARARAKMFASFNERKLIPAWQRYDGALYAAGRQALADLMAAGNHVVILSGGYGAVLAEEPIGQYEARLNPAWWPNRLIERVLPAYAQRHGIVSVRALVAATGPYVSILKRIRWRDAGINDALLFTPQVELGAMRRSPATQGEALVALRDGILSPSWRSSYGLGLHIHRNAPNSVIS
jgi:hypothetical protein